MIDHEYSIDRMQSPIFKKYYREWQKTFRYKQENGQSINLMKCCKETLQGNGMLMPTILQSLQTLRVF